MDDQADPERRAAAQIRAWVMAEIGPWLGHPLADDHDATLEHWNQTQPDVYIVELRDGVFRVRKKPPGTRGGIDGAAGARANVFANWIAAAARRHLGQIQLDVPVFVGDGALANPAVPLFSFQKPAGNRSLLLPDIDLISNRFTWPRDTLAYADKSCHAIFAGSTTGSNRILSVERVRSGDTNPRIQAAIHFRGHPDVTFVVPNVVQHNSPLVVDALAELDIGIGRRIEWPEQFANRFVISMDGNGATCARVATALGGNSVLMKYDSPSQLYYFHGLRPWQHYIPIATHDDIPAAIAAERARPGLFRPLVEEARRFAATYLTEAPARLYTGLLLQQYARLRGLDPALHGPPPATLTVHVRSKGDVSGQDDAWVGLLGSRLWIEGFEVIPPPWLGDATLTCQALNADGTSAAPVAAGGYCGTRGASRMLQGLMLSLSPAAAAMASLAITLRLTSGHEEGPFEAGQPIRLTPQAVAQGVGIEALRLVWTRRGDPPQVRWVGSKTAKTG